jgi:hypothetical protein
VPEATELGPTPHGPFFMYIALLSFVIISSDRGSINLKFFLQHRHVGWTCLNRLSSKGLAFLNP